MAAITVRARAGATKVRRDVVEHRVEHRLGETPGVGVVAAAVIAVEQHPAAVERVPRAVTEYERGGRQPERHSDRAVRDAPEREHRAAGGEVGEFRRKIRVAVTDFRRQWLVRRRQALHRIGDPALDEREPILPIERHRSRCEAVAVQRPVEQDARMVAGERSPGGIRAVQAGREPDDDEARVLRAEGCDGPAEVGRLGFAHLVEKAGEASAAPTCGIVRRSGELPVSQREHGGGWAGGVHRDIAGGHARTS